MNLLNITELMAYGTSEGVRKEWDTRGRSRSEKFITGKDGAPMTFYRGETSGEMFDKFDPKKTGGLFFFATDPVHAKYYARHGSQPREFNLQAKNVLDLRNINYTDKKQMGFLRDFASFFEGDEDRGSGEPYDVISAIEGGTLYDKEGNGSGDAWRQLFYQAAGHGYDAVLANDVTDGVSAPIAVVFNPDQIKFLDKK